MGGRFDGLVKETSVIFTPQFTGWLLNGSELSTKLPLDSATQWQRIKVRIETRIERLTTVAEGSGRPLRR